MSHVMSNSGLSGSGQLTYLGVPILVIKKKKKIAPPSCSLQLSRSCGIVNGLACHVEVKVCEELALWWMEPSREVSIWGRLNW